jgi:CRISPR-associated protein Csx3
MCRDIAYRPLPFLVDAGGKPQAWQEAIFDQCSHAILLVKDAASRQEWQAMMDKYNIPIIAVLTSQLEGDPNLEAERPMVRGTITQLERGQLAGGPVFEALLARVKALFNYSYEELLNIHQQQAPTDLVVDLVTLYRQLKPAGPDYRWQPQDLPDVLDDLPHDGSLALYGRGPTWLYAAVSNHVYPNPFYQFDARRGWVKPAQLQSSPKSDLPLAITTAQETSYLHLKIELSADYLEYGPALALPIPPAPLTGGVILDGKLPNWLYTGLTLFYRTAPWVACYYPPLDRAIIVVSGEPAGPQAIGTDLRL